MNIENEFWQISRFQHGHWKRVCIVIRSCGQRGCLGDKGVEIFKGQISQERRAIWGKGWGRESRKSCTTENIHLHPIYLDRVPLFSICLLFGSPGPEKIKCFTRVTSRGPQPLRLALQRGCCGHLRKTAARRAARRSREQRRTKGSGKREQERERQKWRNKAIEHTRTITQYHAQAFRFLGLSGPGFNEK